MTRPTPAASATRRPPPTPRTRARTAAAAAALLALSMLAAPAARAAPERRCGWLHNPTPNNFSLEDREAEWIISEQGQYSAPGMDNMPDMTTRGWVETNVHYGYGCACITAALDRRTRRVTRLVSAQPMPLARCRADRTLPRP